MKPESFGQRLKRLRERAGLSQAQLAAAANIPIGTLRGAEYDRREPLVGTANKLARALGVSLDELVGSETNPAEEPAPKPRGRPPKAKGGDVSTPAPKKPRKHKAE